MAKTKSTRRNGRRNRSGQGGGAEQRGLPFGAKSEFVRSRPTMTARAIVVEAAQHGIKLTTGHVYNIRAMDKRRGDRPPVQASAGQGVAAERQLRALIVRVGLDRAEAILADLKTTFGSATSAPVRRRGRRARGSSTGMAEAAEASSSQTA